MIASFRIFRSPRPYAAGVLAVALGIHAFVDAQAVAADKVTSASATQAAPAAVAERSPEYPHPTNIPAELLRPRRPQAMILPAVPAESPEGISDETRSGGVIAEVTPTERLLPEGYVLGRRPARFGRDEAWWAIAIGEAAGLPVGPPLRVLPNRRLMLLERVLTEGKPEDTYLVTGRVTEFLGHNYVLLEQVISPPEHRPAAQIEAAPAPRPPRNRRHRGRPGPRPPARSSRSSCRTHRPARAASAPADAEAARRGNDGNQRVQPEGTIVPEFPARLVRSESWWTLTRESQGSRPVGPPYFVLPNRLLEVMVSTSAGGTRSVVFLVSGELTEYRGTNYLLVHKVLIRRDLGNLR